MISQHEVVCTLVSACIAHLLSICGLCPMRVHAHHVANCLGCTASKPGAVVQVVAAPDASFTAGKLDFGGLADGQAWLVRVQHCCVFTRNIPDFARADSPLHPASVIKHGR